MAEPPSKAAYRQELVQEADRARFIAHEHTRRAHRMAQFYLLERFEDADILSFGGDNVQEVSDLVEAIITAAESRVVARLLVADAEEPALAVPSLPDGEAPDA